ncbi:hypothetical protein ACIP98_23880 [Streptomyces sp. NPDC088354]|uniref:hypothetical protein n=1 Tax=Streptomyces sp. NPDC088354 TaxID=3365856 RepID=UPI00381BD0D4
MSQDNPVPEQAPPAPEAPPEAAAETPAAAVPETLPAARPPRRRGRTTLLVLAAAVLGVAAGAGTGYAIQYDRPETPLPPLTQRALVQPKGAAPKAKPLTAAEDTLVTYDGDLRKLLLKRPKGAKDWRVPPGIDGWLAPAEFADTYESAKYGFSDILGDGFRRAATTTWETRDSSVEIRLVQYRDLAFTATESNATGQIAFTGGKDEAGNDGREIPGSVDGKAFVYSKPIRKAGYLPLYKSAAVARKANIEMLIWVTSAHPIPGSTIMSLAERQLERL